MSLLEKLLGAIAILGAAVVTPLWKLRNALDKKADKKETNDRIEKCLRHIELLYKANEEDRADTRRQFGEAMETTRTLHADALKTINEGQRQIIDILTRR